MRALFASALLAALCLSCAAPAPGGEPDLAPGSEVGGDGRVRDRQVLDPGPAKDLRHSGEDPLQLDGPGALAVEEARLALERLINPFLRTREASIVAVARARDPAAVTDEQVFAVIRQWKNDFK